MSRGIGAHAKKVLEDDETVIYEYGGYNLNGASSACPRQKSINFIKVL